MVLVADGDGGGSDGEDETDSDIQTFFYLILEKTWQSASHLDKRMLHVFINAILRDSVPLLNCTSRLIPYGLALRGL